MTGVVFAPDDAEAPAPGTERIDSGAFWPTIALADVRNAMRIDKSVTHARLFHIATTAVLYVNRQLAAFHASAAQNGITELAKIEPDKQINGTTVAEWHYRRAVYCYALADLLENYADHTATGNTAERAEAKQSQSDDYRREAHAAIADLLGRARHDCELI